MWDHLGLTINLMDATDMWWRFCIDCKKGDKIKVMYIMYYVFILDTENTCVCDRQKLKLTVCSF